MNSVMKYKGHLARIEIDADEGLLVGHLAGIDDIVGFHAESVEDLRRAFHEAVDDYVATCAKIGKAPQKPYSGKMMFRVSPDLHADAARAAELSGKSLNQWGTDVLRAAAEAGT